MKKQILHLTIGCSTAAVGFGSGVVLAQEIENDGSESVEEVIVTGTRIKRSEFSDAAQVVDLDRLEIDAMGLLTAADVLRASPLNTYGSLNEQSGSSAMSNATVDLRGLGDSRTLVMIDGRRLVGSPNLGAAVINLNMIPMAAVESVNILADGSSAVYGSDAVAGVVNMRMRKDFEGLEVATRYGERSEDDGIEYGVSFIAGTKGERSNITIALESNHRDPIWDRDRSYTAPWTRDTGGDGTIDAYFDTDGYSIYGKSIWLYDPTTGFDQIKAGNSCAPGNGFLGVVDADLDWGYPADTDENTYCMYGYADVSANKAEITTLNAYVDTSYDISDTVELYTTTIFSKVEAFGRYAPAADTWDDMPADHSDVPFDIPALIADGSISEDYSLTGFYRWTASGTRDNEVTDLQTDVVVGLRGDITDSVSYDTYAQYSKYTSKEFGYYYLSYLGLDYILNAGEDPFDEQWKEAMSAVTTQDNYTKMFKTYGHVQFSLGEINGGEVLALAGAEYSVLDYQNRYDRASEAGFVGGSSGNSSNGDRDIFSAFGEVILPITDSFELSAAARYDDYTDFGDKTSFTLASNWNIASLMTWRVRIGQGFRAPGLDQLYGPDTFSAESASDIYNCSLNNIAPEDCGSSQFDTYFSTNPELKAETSNSLSTGVNFEISSGITVDVSAWQIKIEDVIVKPLPQSIFYAEIAGVDLDESQGTYIDRQGGRAVVYSQFTNQGELSVSGLDLQVDILGEGDFEPFYAKLFLTRLLSYEEAAYFNGPNTDKNGFNLQPKYRAQAMLGWSYNNHSIDWVLDVIGTSSEQDFVEFTDDDKPYLTTSENDLGSWKTINLSYAYDGEKWGKIRIGARNLLNEDPILDRTGKYDATHYDLYDNTGRVLFMEYKVSL